MRTPSRGGKHFLGGKLEVLLAGNTGFVTEQWVEHAFAEDRVVVARKDAGSLSGGRITTIDLENDADSETVLSSYRFDRIVYFFESLTLHSDSDGNLGRLRGVLHATRDTAAQVLLVTGPESEFTHAGNDEAHETSKSLMSRAGEELGRYYAQTYAMSVKIVRCPYLYEPHHIDTSSYLDGLFEQASEGEVAFCERPEQEAYFLCADDLAELVRRIYDDWTTAYEVLHVPNTFHPTFRDLARAITNGFPEAKIRYGTDTPYGYPDDDGVLRRRYGWSPRYSVIDDLPMAIDTWRQAKEKHDRRTEHRFWQKLQQHSRILGAIEIVVAAILVEWLVAATSGQSQISQIDFRLLYVVIAGTIYGLNAGVFAAVLACIGVLFEYSRNGASFLPLLYDPTNWLTFVAYLIAGAVCGYVRMRNQEHVRFVRDENNLLRERLTFLRGLYQGVLDDRTMLRRQILGRRDSFGKMYEMTRKLDEVQPQKIYRTAIQIMQDTLETDCLGIYRLDESQRFARLVAASPQEEAILPKSADVAAYDTVMRDIEAKGLWVNRELDGNLPMYAAGVREHGRIGVVVVIRKAAADQMNLYYRNLFLIICGLVESAMTRAFEYEHAARQSMLVPGTSLLNWPSFREKLRAAVDLGNDRMGSHLLLMVTDQYPEAGDFNERIVRSIRETDDAGVLADGSVCLLMNQAGERELPIVSARLARNGLNVRNVDAQSEADLLAEAYTDGDAS